MGSIFKPRSTTVPASSSGSVKYEIPEYFKKAQEELFARASAESKKPYEAYSGERIAGLTQLQKDAQAAAEQNLGAFAKSGATQQATNLMNQAGQVAGERFEGATVDQYMNPYIQNVVNRSMANLGEIAGQQRQGRDATQIGAGAYGGSRAAIENALAQEREMKAGGDLTAQLYGQGFEQGRSAFMTDRSGRYSDLMTRAQMTPAMQLQKQQAAMQEAGAAGQYGALQQALNQAQMSENYKDFIEQQGYGRGQLGFLSQILGNAPIRSYGEQREGTQDQVIGGTSPFGQIAGAGLSAYSLYQSDMRLKEDIKLVGQSPSGINIYNFKYLHSDDTYQGVMAQEVPSASKLIDGHYYVDYSKVDVEFKKLN